MSATERECKTIYGSLWLLCKHGKDERGQNREGQRSHDSETRGGGGGGIRKAEMISDQRQPPEAGARQALCGVIVHAHTDKESRSHPHAQTNTRSYVWTSRPSHTHTYINVHTLTDRNTPPPSRTHTHAHTYERTHTHTHSHTHIDTCTQIYINTNAKNANPYIQIHLQCIHNHRITSAGEAELAH